MLDRHHVTNNIDQVFSPHHNAGDIFDKVIDTLHFSLNIS